MRCCAQAACGRHSSLDDSSSLKKDFSPLKKKDSHRFDDGPDELHAHVPAHLAVDNAQDVRHAQLLAVPQRKVAAQEQACDMEQHELK